MMEVAPVDQPTGVQDPTLLGAGLHFPTHYLHERQSADIQNIVLDAYDDVVDPLPANATPHEINAHQIHQLNRMIIFKLDRERRRKQGEDCGISPDWALMLHKFLHLSSTQKYEKIKFIGDGTYSNVYKVRSTVTGVNYAMKKIKSPSSSTQVSLTTLREMKVLLTCHHPNLINLIEFVVGNRPCSLGYVLEYGEVDILALIKRLRVPFELKHTKSMIQQVLQALAYMHEKNVVHRDIKLSNFLLTMDGTLKVCDFGLARGLYDENADLTLTPLVVTLWYRAPELLLGETHYSTSVDLWAAGCIFYELITLKPLFPGKTELDEIDVIFSKLGTPTDSVWPGYSSLPHCQKFEFTHKPGTDWAASMVDNSTESERDIVKRCLIYRPESRITAQEGLRHPFFTEAPLPEKFLLSKELIESIPNAVHTT